MTIHLKKILNRAWAEIHLDRARKNLEILTSLLDTKYTKPVCVIKANAYGHGDVEMMKLYQSMGVDFFAVSNLNEAVKLRNGGCVGEILVLSWSPADSDTIAMINENNIIQTAVSYEHAKQLSELSTQNIRIHIKLDTGMGRVGLCTDDISKCADTICEIAAMKNLVIEGIFTHFAVADSILTDKVDYTNEQKRRFFDVITECEHKGVNFKHIHCTNSAAAVIHKDNRSLLARLGITLYGLTPDMDMDLPQGLEPVMDFRAVVSHVKTVKKGQTIGYGRTYTAPQDIIVATIPVGYADGYARLLSNRSEVLIHGKRAKSVGRICMDQMMVDVSDIENVKMGDICTLIGRDGDDIITADELAEIYGTIGYETVCAVSGRVPRIYFDNGVRV